MLLPLDSGSDAQLESLARVQKDGRHQRVVIVIMNRSCADTGGEVSADSLIRKPAQNVDMCAEGVFPLDPDIAGRDSDRDIRMVIVEPITKSRAVGHRDAAGERAERPDSDRQGGAREPGL